MARYCLYCGLQFADTTKFCPNCGRPTASSFSIRPLQKQESEVDCLRKELQEKNELIRQLLLTQTQRGDTYRTAARRVDPCAHGGSEGRQANTRVLSSGRC